MDYPVYPTIAAALKSEKFQYVVIANETEKHYDTLDALKKGLFGEFVLVEKPLFFNPKDFQRGSIKKIFVGYNLRFHPLIQKLRRAVREEKCLSAQVYVGKYLPKWRPQTDYRAGYSARKSAGGGVLRDLSHEIDYLLWIFGAWTKVSAIGGHFSHLEIDSDDVFALLFATEKCPAITLQLNYVDRANRREIIVNTDKHTYGVDLVRNTYTCDETTELSAVDPDFTYQKEHQNILDHNEDVLCSYDEGFEVLKFIEAAEKSNGVFQGSLS